MGQPTAQWGPSTGYGEMGGSSEQYHSLGGDQYHGHGQMRGGSAQTGMIDPNMMTSIIQNVVATTMQAMINGPYGPRR